MASPCAGEIYLLNAFTYNFYYWYYYVFLFLSMSASVYLMWRENKSCGGTVMQLWMLLVIAFGTLMNNKDSARYGGSR